MESDVFVVLICLWSVVVKECGVKWSGGDLMLDGGMEDVDVDIDV